MDIETLKKEIKKNQSVVDNFYEKALNSLENKNKENKEKVQNMNKEEQRIENEIKKNKEEIEKIKKNKSNYINGDQKNHRFSRVFLAQLPDRDHGAGTPPEEGFSGAPGENSGGSGG